MNFKNFNIKIIIVALLSCLLLLFIGQFLYQKYNIIKPLERFYLKTHQIKEYKIDKAENRYIVTVNLKDIENLKAFYEFLQNNTKLILNNNQFEIKIDNRTKNKKLNDVFSKIQFPIYEAMQKGNYIEMEKEIMNISGNNGIYAKIYIDDKNIYLKLRYNDEEMYSVIQKANKTDTL